MAYPFQDTECSNLSIDSRQRIRSDWGRLRTKIGSKAKKVSANLSSKVLAFKPLTKAIKLEQASRKNKFKFEGLEPRLLFSADPLTALLESATNMELTVESDSVLLRDISDNSILAQQLLADTSSVFITGSLGDDSLTIDNSIFANGNSLSVTFDGGDGVDRISGSTLTGSINWGFVGYDTGEESQAGDIFFSDIESLVAGTGTNTLFGDDVDRNWVLSEVDTKTQIDTTFFDGTAGASRFTDFDAIIAGLENDYIVDQSNTSSWDITTFGAGSIDGFNFDNFEFLTGGSGLDTLLNFSSYTQGINVDLTTDADNDNYGYASGFEGVLGFEHVTGSAFDDWIFGDSASNTIIGLDGDDTLKGGTGNDNLQGGDDTDTLIVERNARLDLFDTELLVDAVKEDDISDFENANLIGGVDGNIIDASSFTLGYVVLDGRGGDDFLTGTDFDDTLTGGLGVDSIDGGSGGVDTVSESQDANFTLTDSALTIGSDAADTLINIDAAILVGGDGDNIINAAAFSNSTNIDGGAGADIITGSGADDILTGGLGDDTIDGLGGNDLLVEQGGGNFVLNNTSLVHQSNEVQSVAITGVTQGSYTITFNDGSTTATTQAIAFNAASSDVQLALASLSNLSAADFTLSSAVTGWAITFDGALSGLALANLIVASNDTDGDVTVTKNKVGAADTDTLTAGSIETVELIGDFSDNTLDASAFTTGKVNLYGISGRNTLLGGAGDDIISGGAQNDVLSGGAGEDTITGYAGTDTLRESADVSFTLTNTDLRSSTNGLATSEVDVLSGIEYAELTGGAGDNVIDASAFSGISSTISLRDFTLGEGLDLTSGAEFSITLSDASSVDIDLNGTYTIDDVLDAITASHENLTASFDLDTSQIVIADTTAGGSNLAVTGKNNSTAINQLGLTLAGNPAELRGTALSFALGGVSLSGGAGIDTLTGSRNNDILSGGEGNDLLFGGAGSDTVAEVRDADMVLVNNTLTITSGATPDTDALNSIETATLTGGTSANSIDSSGFSLGAVTLSTGGGTDTLTAGNDFSDKFVVDVSNLTQGADQVTINTSGDLTDVVEIDKTHASGDVSQADLGWVSFVGTASAAYQITGLRDINLTSDLNFGGQSITLNAHSENGYNDGFKINTNGFNIITSSAGNGGNITLLADHINIGAGTEINALGGASFTSGDVTIQAFNEKAIFTGGFISYDEIDVDITIADSVTISGKDVVIEAKADSEKFFNESDLGGGTVGGLLESSLNTVIDIVSDSLASLLPFSIAVSKSYADINIGDADISGDSVRIAAAANINVSASSQFGTPIAAGYGDTRASVIISGELAAADGNVTVTSDVSNKATVEAESGAINGLSAAMAVFVLDSVSSVHLTDDSAVSVTNGNLLVRANAIDETEVSAEATAKETEDTATAEDDGALALAFALAIENTNSSAYVDGSVDVNRLVSADTTKGKVDISSNHSQASGSVKTRGGVDDIGIKDKLIDPTFAKIPGASKISDFLGMKMIEDGIENLQEPVINALENILPTGEDLDFDLAGALSLYFDTNTAKVRIGETVDDGDGQYADVEADGQLNLSASVVARPKVSATTEAKDGTTNPFLKNADGTAASKGIAISVAHETMTNDADASIGVNAAVDAKGAITITAESINQIDPESFSGVNLVTPFLDVNTGSDYKSSQTASVSLDEVVEVTSAKDGTLGNPGARYKYLSNIETGSVDLSTVDYEDEAYWEKLPSGNTQITTVAQEFAANLESQLNAQLGIQDNIADTFVSSQTEGQKNGLAGKFAILVLNESADVEIHSGALINRDDDGVTGTDNFNTGQRVVTLDAHNINHSVALAPTLPVIAGASSSESSSAGMGLVVVVSDNDAASVIHDGASVFADSLLVDAENTTIAASLAMSGSSAKNGGYNGALVFNVVDNSTTAQIDNGAIVDVGSLHARGTDSLVVSAVDTAHIIGIAGALSSSEGTAVGASVGSNIIMRDTHAVIGNLYGESVVGTEGTITVAGASVVDARNEGFIGSFAVSGTKSAPAKKAGNTPATGTGGTSGSDGSSQSTHDLAAWQANYSQVISQMRSAETTQDAGDANAAASAKSGSGISGAVTVNVLQDDARAYAHDLASLDVSNALKLNAANATHAGSLAGAVAYAQNANSAKAIAGAVGVNVLWGETEAIIDNIGLLSAGSLDIDAKHFGVVGSLVAGVGVTSGRSGVSVAGSVAVNTTDYSVRTGLKNIGDGVDGTLDADINGSIDLLAEDSTILISVAGGVAYGSKVGVGAGISVASVVNTVESVVENVESLEHDGSFKVKAHSQDTIVGVAGAAGISTGGAGQGKGIAGTFALNYLSNTVTANIINTQTLQGSSDIEVYALDDSNVFAFSGAVGYGKSAGLGIAFGLNFYHNTLTAAVDNSTLRGSRLTVQAIEGGWSATAAVGGAGSQSSASGAGAVAVTEVQNVTSATISNGSDIDVTGDVIVSAVNSMVNVNVAGGIAFSTQGAAGGAAIGVNLMDADTTANIDSSGVNSGSGGVNVNAMSDATLVSVGIGGAGGQKFVLGGSVSINELSNDTFASITNSLNTDKDTVLVSALKDIDVLATDQNVVVAVTGAGAISMKGLAIGAAVSTVNAQNNTRANISNTKVRSTGTLANGYGNVNVLAGVVERDQDVDLASRGVQLETNSGQTFEDVDLSSNIINVTLAGAYGSSTALSGVINLNWLKNNVEAYISDSADVTAHNSINVRANDDGSLINVAVAAAVSSSATSGAVAISYNYIGGDPGDLSPFLSGAFTAPDNSTSTESSSVLAYIDNAKADAQTGAVVVNAEAAAKLINVSIGGAGSSSGVAVGGSIAINFIRHNVKAEIKGGADVDAGTTIDVNARTIETMVVVAGGGAGSGGSAAGLVFSLNEAASNTEANILGATTDVDATGNIEVNAADSSSMIVIAVGGSGATNNAGGVVIATTQVANTVNASINAADVTSTAGSVDVTSGFSPTGDALDFGILGINVVELPDEVDLGSQIITVAVAGAGAGNNSGAGVISLNWLKNNVSASITNTATVTAATNVNVKAKDEASIINVAAGITGSGNNAGGVAIAFNYIGGDPGDLSPFLEQEFSEPDNSSSATDGSDAGHVLAYIDNATVNAINGFVEVLAEGKAELINVSIGGAGSANNAIGGSIAINFIRNFVKAEINSGADVDAGTVIDVNALSRETMVVVAGGIAGSGNNAAGLVLSINETATTTEANILGADTDVDATGNITVNAADSTTMVVVAIGGAVSGNNAIGAAVGTTLVGNSIKASIAGATVDSTEGDVNVLSGFLPLPNAEDTDLSAVMDTSVLPDDVDLGSQIINVTVAGAGSGNNAAGGAISLNWLKNRVEASISSGAVVTAANNINVKAKDVASLISVAVSVAGSGNAAGGAAISYNYIGGDPGDPSREVPSDPAASDAGYVLSFIDNATADALAGEVNVFADANPEIVNVSIGGAGSGNIALGGSISINFIRNIVKAEIKGGATVDAHTDINVLSTTSPLMVIVAGGGSGSGNLAFGLAAATNDLVSTQVASIDGAGTVATADTGDIIVVASIVNNDTTPSVTLADDGVSDDDDAQFNAQIWSFAVSGSGSGNVAGAGSLSLNWIRNDIQAYIADGATANATTNGKKVDVRAKDMSTINALAGAGSGAGTAAIGASVAYNYIGGDPDNPGSDTESTIKAYINNATVNADSVNVNANSSSDINNISFAGGGAGTFAGSGSLSLNWIRKDIDARISNSDVGSTDNITVVADDTSGMHSIAAQANGAGVVAVGAAIAYSDIENNINAGIDAGSDVTVANSPDGSRAGNVVIKALSEAEIETVAVSVSGSGTAALAGSGGGSLINNRINAFISGSTVATPDSVVVFANSNDTIASYGGSAGISGTVGAGGSVFINKLSSETKAYVSLDSTVTALGAHSANVDYWADNGDSTDVTYSANQAVFGLAVVANTANDIDVISAAAGASGVVGIAANVISNIVETTAEAYISDSSVNSNNERGATVRVMAHQQTDIESAGGAVAGGQVGVGAAVDLNVINNTTKAYISDDDRLTDTAENQDHIFANDVHVVALSDEAVRSVVVGASVGLYFGGTGVGATIVSTSNTNAFIRLAKVTTTGGVNVQARSYASTDFYGGALAGGAVGVGATVVIGVLDGTTQASVEGAIIRAGAAVDVSAKSFEDINVVAVSGAGGIAGLAGAVSVMTTTSDTLAWIGSHANVSADVEAGTDVKVTANNQTDVNKNGTIEGFVGAAGVGGVGIGASVEVITINNNVNAYIGDNASVLATNNVRVKANAERNVDSTVIAFGGGAGVGISGGVSVITIGAGIAANSEASNSSSGAQEAIDNVQTGDSGGYTTSTRYVPSNGTVTLFNGDTVDAANGKRYKFTPSDETAGVNLATQNYASSGDWSEVGNTRDFTNAAHTTTAATATLSTNHTVDIVTAYSLTGSGTIGHRYAYLGTDNLTVTDWSNEDFSDKAVWQDLGQRQKFFDQSADVRSDKKAAVVARGAAAAETEAVVVTLVAEGQSGTNAYIGVNATVTATTGDIEVKADENIDLNMVVG